MKVAVVGYGHIGKQHCANVLGSDNMNLTHICDPYITQKDIPDGVIWIADYDSWIESLEANDIDLLIIATPNHLHHPMLVKAMTTYPFAGTPILAEKPIVLHEEEIQEIEYLQDQRLDEGKSEIPIFVNYPLRFLPSVMKLKKEWNSIGEIRLVNTGVFWNRNEGYYEASEWRGKLVEEGGPLFNEFIHHLDLIAYLCGDISSVGGAIRDFAHDYTEVEDTGIINLTFKTGGVGTMSYSVASPKKSFDVNFHFMGDEGCAKLTGLYNNQLFINEDGFIFEINRNHYGAVLDAIYENLLNNVSDERLASWEDGIKSVRLINQYYYRVRKHNLDKGDWNTTVLTEENRSR
jgi:UDP-N-acetyl-2-amino-2-deoxyglucuronate dehydrogenase